MRLQFSETHPYVRWHNPEVPYPLVPVTIYGPTGLAVPILALIDSGADDCIFSADYAEEAGINVKSGRREKRFGIVANHHSWVYVHEIELRIGNAIAPFRAPVAFEYGRDLDPTEQLVGRERVFERLRIGFRESREFLYIAEDAR